MIKSEHTKPKAPINYRKEETPMAPFEVIRGGHAFEDPNEIPAPNKPYSEWSEAEKEEYFILEWQLAEEGTVEHVVKNLDAPDEAISTALDVLEKIRLVCNADDDRLGLRHEFDHETLPELLACLRQRVRENNANKVIAE